jgi:hypothetical protein
LRGTILLVEIFLGEFRHGGLDVKCVLDRRDILFELGDAVTDH